MAFLTLAREVPPTQQVASIEVRYADWSGATLVTTDAGLARDGMIESGLPCVCFSQTVVLTEPEACERLAAALTDAAARMRATGRSP